jgi:F-type H+-transporting ATPase subunit b
MRRSLLISVLAFGAILSGNARAEEKAGHAHAHAHPVKYKAELKTKDGKHKEASFEIKSEEHKKALVEALEAGEIETLHIEHTPNPMEIVWDLGLWAIVVFVFLVLILRKAAWGPMLEGLQKREQTIKDAVDEAKKARADTERITKEFKGKMDEAYAEIPKMMETARRDAENFKEEMRAQTTKEIATERQRLRREIETARDQALQELWSQAAQLATLISAKAIGRSLTEEDHRRLLDEAIADLGQAAHRG